MATEREIQSAKTVLMMYCEPKPQYNGMSAYETAKLLVEAVESAQEVVEEVRVV